MTATGLADHVIYTLSASGRKDYAWYRLEPGGTTVRVPYDPAAESAEPPGWKAVGGWVRPGRPSLLVFPTPDGPGVLVSAIPSARRRMGAPLQEFILLVHTRPWYSRWQRGLVAALLRSSPGWGAPLTGFGALAASIHDPGPGDPEAVVRIDGQALAAALDALADEVPERLPDTDALPEGAWRDDPETRQQLLRALLAPDVLRPGPAETAAGAGRGQGRIVAAVVTDLAADRLTPAVWALTSHGKAPSLRPDELVGAAGTGPGRTTRSEQGGGCVFALVLWCGLGLAGSLAAGVSRRGRPGALEPFSH